MRGEGISRSASRVGRIHATDAIEDLAFFVWMNVIKRKVG